MGIRQKILIISLILLSGCKNPFATREPEEPSPGSGAGSILDPTSSENVLKNLEISYRYENLNINDYMGTLSDDFLFVPDLADKNAYPEVFSQPWSKQQEEEFTRRLFDKSVTSYLILDAEYSLEETGEIDHYSYSYSLSIIHNKDAPKAIRGKAELYLRQDQQGNWSIFRWEDQKTEKDSSTWGELRARF